MDAYQFLLPPLGVAIVPQRAQECQALWSPSPVAAQTRSSLAQGKGPGKHNGSLHLSLMLTAARAQVRGLGPLERVCPILQKAKLLPDF